MIGKMALSALLAASVLMTATPEVRAQQPNPFLAKVGTEFSYRISDKPMRHASYRVIGVEGAVVFMDGLAWEGPLQATRKQLDDGLKGKIRRQYGESVSADCDNGGGFEEFRAIDVGRSVDYVRNCKSTFNGRVTESQISIKRTALRSEKIITPAGAFDAVVFERIQTPILVTLTEPGKSPETRQQPTFTYHLWFVPALGMIAKQQTLLVDGKPYSGNSPIELLVRVNATR